MSAAAAQHARNLVVMLAAGGAMDDVLEMAKSFGVRAVQVQQLAVPNEEANSRTRLIEALRPNGNGDTK